MAIAGDDALIGRCTLSTKHEFGGRVKVDQIPAEHGSARGNLEDAGRDMSPS